MKRLAVDLFCGKGGWTNGLQAAGFEVIGVDIKRYPGYAGDHFIQADIRNVGFVLGAIVAVAKGRRVEVVVRSPPCQRFSLARAGRVADPPTEADLELMLSSNAIMEALEPTWEATENVRGALPWFNQILGEPRLRHGPFYIWGNFPPFLVERAGLRKGIYGSKSPTTLRLGKQTRRPAMDAAMLPIELTRPMAFAMCGNKVNNAQSNEANRGQSR